MMKTDIEIARSITLQDIKQVAKNAGIPEDQIENYGHYIAKLPINLIDDKKVNILME